MAFDLLLRYALVVLAVCRAGTALAETIYECQKSDGTAIFFFEFKQGCFMVEQLQSNKLKPLRMNLKECRRFREVYETTSSGRGCVKQDPTKSL